MQGTLHEETDQVRARPELQLVNTSPKYSAVNLVEPTALGYVYIGAAIEPGRLPIILPNGRRASLLKKLKELARLLVERDERVVDAAIFRAIVMPPTGAHFSYVKQHAASLHIPDFDVLALIQTTSPATAAELEGSAAYTTLLETIRANACAVYVMPARNIKRIADVRAARKSLFLFNHFAAEDRRVMQKLWEYLADWYVHETGLTNSVALAPLDDARSPYAIVNWACWNVGPLRHFWHQLSKRSFWRYVTGNLEANHAASMPIYCRLA